jgi:hypothetical protein
MFKILTMLFLTISSSNALADWTPIDSNANFKTYVDSGSLRKAGKNVKIVLLIDYNVNIAISGKPYVSLKTQHEFKCNEQQFRMLSSIFYSGHLGSGTEVETNFIPDNWAPVATHSIVENMWRVACGK